MEANEVLNLPIGRVLMREINKKIKVAIARVQRPKKCDVCNLLIKYKYARHTKAQLYILTECLDCFLERVND